MKVATGFFSRPAAVIIVFSVTMAILGSAANYYVSAIHRLRFPYPGGDANHYRVLAEALFEKHAFVIPSGVPESDRTPGYPAFLAVLYALIRNWVLVAFVQSLLLALVPIFTYFLASRFFDRAAAMAAGFLTAADPIRLFNSSILLSDGLFTLLFLTSLFLLFKYADSPDRPLWLILIAGLILGYATLVRQVGFFLPLIFLVYLFASGKIKFPGLKISALLMGGFLLFVAPWSLRNKAVFDRWQLSPEGLRIVAYHDVPSFLEFKTGKPVQEFRRELDQKLVKAGVWEESFGGEKIYADYIKKNIGLVDVPRFAFFYAVKTAPFFLNDGLRDLARFLGFSSTTSFPNITTFILNGDLTELSKVLFSDWKNTGLLVLGSSFMLFCLFSAAYGIFIFMRRRDSNLSVIFFLTLLIFYFALASGPVSNFRLRLPVMPLILILAVNGAHLFWKSLFNSKSTAFIAGSDSKS